MVFGVLKHHENRRITSGGIGDRRAAQNRTGRSARNTAAHNTPAASKADTHNTAAPEAGIPATSGSYRNTRAAQYDLPGPSACRSQSSGLAQIGWWSAATP